jgi:co-chaperonin GroES (HSP10)
MLNEPVDEKWLAHKLDSELDNWEDKIYYVPAGLSQVGLSCIGDQIIVLEDKFRTGFECSKCDGEGYSEEDCDFCKGTGKENAGTDQESLCRICCPRNLVDSGQYTPGKRLCDNCQGKGSLIIAPQISQQKPSIGVIVSTGPDVYPDCRVINRVTGQRWAYPMKIGDRLLYSRFAGSGIELKQKKILRVMHAHEAMCKIYGQAKLGDFTR